MQVTHINIMIYQAPERRVIFAHLHPTFKLLCRTTDVLQLHVRGSLESLLKERVISRDESNSTFSDVVYPVLFKIDLV